MMMQNHRQALDSESEPTSISGPFVMIPTSESNPPFEDSVREWSELRNRSGDVRDLSRAEPDATYRLQFHAGFTFRDASALVPYLAALGITHVYASPFLKAVEGSSHGYDIVDQSSLNPEIGSQDDFDDFVDELHANGLGQILDVVPNHMGVASNDNVWWRDVLENGPSSIYASFFDIDWMPLKPDLANKVLLPVLADQFGRVLEAGQLTLCFEEGAFYVKYFDRSFPIGMRSSSILLSHRLDVLEQLLSSGHSGDPLLSGPSAEKNPGGGETTETAELMEYRSILTAISHLAPRTETDPNKNDERRREQEVIKRRLRELCQNSSVINAFLIENVRLFNGCPGDPSSFDLLDHLLLEQAYRLAYWRVAADEINYRRFFDVNELAAICMDRPEVFEKTHSLIFRMVEQGQIDGLRIDHPDGLYDPSKYLRQLQLHGSQHRMGSSNSANLQRKTDTAFEIEDSPHGGCLVQIGSEGNTPLYLVVEKILGRGEQIPQEWPINGTTGYDFLNSANGLFVDRNSLRAFDRLYAKFIRESPNLRDLVYRCKKQIMDVSMSSEVNVLGHQLDNISARNRVSRDFTLNSLTDTLREIIACFPVYRTYIDERGVSDQDRQYVEQAVARAKRRNPAISASIFDFVRDVLLLNVPMNSAESVQEEWLKFVGRFQQVTGPVMAKGVEDTAFYIFNRLVSLNEVGGDPDRFGTTVAAFHQQNLDRQAKWPYAMLTLSTHDTKRTEDVRSRLNVLSEIPTDWQRRLVRWSRINARKKIEVDSELAPSRNDEYLLYQTLVGTWPLGGLTAESHVAYLERIQQYMVKAAHEAKVHTSWVSPHEPYDEALKSFINSLLAGQPKNAFLADFIPFVQCISKCGIWNSLAQTVLKLTAPGVPDIYQGCEIWDFSLVDPDNRRPVDFELRRQMLAAIQLRLQAAPESRQLLVRELLEDPFDGRLKMFVIAQLLHERRMQRGLFTTGAYLPLEAVGPRQEHICAFARRTPQSIVIVVTPRLITQLTNFSGGPSLGEECWQDTYLVIPSSVAGASVKNAFTSEAHRIEKNDAGGKLMLRDIFRTFPVAVLLQPTEASSGELLEAAAHRQFDDDEIARTSNDVPPLLHIAAM